MLTIPAAAPKDVEIASMRIAIQILLNQPREARKSPPHVGMTRRKPHPHIARNRNYRRSSTRQRIGIDLRIDSDQSPVAKLDLDQSIPGCR
jgi:hypothetical protein